VTDDPTYDSEDPPSPDEEPTPAMTGEQPTEPMAGGGPVRERPDWTPEEEAAEAWKELAAARHQPTCAIVLFLQTRDKYDTPVVLLQLPRCTCGADVP